MGHRSRLIWTGILFVRGRQRLAQFRKETSASVAIIFALAAIPMICAIGAAIDYSAAALVRSKLQSAADAASLASVSFNSDPINTALAMSGNGTISGGSSYALNFFNANLVNSVGYLNLSSTATVSKSSQNITATISFTADVPTFFMGLLGYNNIPISGSSTSSYTLPTYIDFYLMFDVSGSMSFPSTQSEQTRLTAINPDNYTLYPNGCSFACHFTRQGACPDSEQKYSTNGYCLGYALTRNAGNSANPPVTSCPMPDTSACIQLRADAVGYAVQQLLATAASSEVVANQYRVGLYPFIRYLYSYYPLTTNLTGSASKSTTINYAAANFASLLDSGANSSLGSGGTHFENALPSMNTLISSVGDGSGPSKALPYVFLITDGAQDSQTQWNGSWSGSNHATVIDSSLCTTLKDRGITIAVLYIPYETIQNPTSFANGEDFAVNAIIPDIPSNLQACASPGFFFAADTPTDITNALLKMFQQVVSTAHISS